MNNRLITGILSLVFPGAGYFFLKQTRWALGTVGLMLICLLGIQQLGGSLALAILFSVLSLGVYLFSFVHGLYLAPKEKPERRLAWPFIATYLLLALLLCGSISGLLAPSQIRLFNIPTLSGAPTLLIGDIIVAERQSTPQRFQLAVFTRPTSTTHYMYRVVGMPGDTLAILDHRLFVDGEPMDIPGARRKYRFRAVARPGKALGESYWQQYGIDILDVYPTGQGILVFLDSIQARQLAQDTLLFSAFGQLIDPPGPTAHTTSDDFPWPQPWNTHQLGPLWLPTQGATLPLDAYTWERYHVAIQEETPEIQFRNGQFFKGNDPIEAYTFQQNYYFVMGDNRDNAMDSRYIGMIAQSRMKMVLRYVAWSDDISRVGLQF